jgi:peptidoglycan hydrolase-like protein with peptidoglycan-binding domain
MNIRRLATRIAVATALTGALVGTAATAAQAAPGAPYIREGSSGFNVWCVQFAINMFNDDPAQAIAEDGDFGGATLKALENYQSAFRVDPDGVVGPATGTVIANQIQSIVAYGNNMATPWGNHISDCYQVLPTDS